VCAESSTGSLRVMTNRPLPADAKLTSLRLGHRVIQPSRFVMLERGRQQAEFTDTRPARLGACASVTSASSTASWARETFKKVATECQSVPIVRGTLFRLACDLARQRTLTVSTVNGKTPVLNQALRPPSILLEVERSPGRSTSVAPFASTSVARSPC
jgi:hypothetical protein